MKKTLKYNLPFIRISEANTLLIFFKPKFFANTKANIDNSNSRLQKVIRKNPEILNLIKVLDLEEEN